MRLTLRSVVAREGADRERSVWYHGSSIKNLRSILTQGLISEVKEKNWGEDPGAGPHTPSRVSYGGVYVTRNLMTALSAPRDRVKEGRELLVFVDLQPRSLVLDEDDLVHILNSPMPSNLQWSDHWVMQYWLAATYQAPEWSEELKQARNNYIEHCMGMLDYQVKLHPQLEERLRLVLPKMWYTALSRLVAHTRLPSYDYKGVYNDIVSHGGQQDWDKIPPIEEVIPSIATAEADYRMRVDALTKTLKAMARPALNQRSNPMQVARMLESVGFSGSNRISGIIEVRDGNDYLKESNKIVKLLVHYGSIPPDFWKQWKERYGYETQIINMTP